MKCHFFIAALFLTGFMVTNFAEAAAPPIKGEVRDDGDPYMEAYEQGMKSGKSGGAPKIELTPETAEAFVGGFNSAKANPHENSVPASTTVAPSNQGDPYMEAYEAGMKASQGKGVSTVVPHEFGEFFSSGFKSTATEPESSKKASAKDNPAPEQTKNSTSTSSSSGSSESGTEWFKAYDANGNPTSFKFWDGTRPTRLPRTGTVSSTLPGNVGSSMTLPQNCQNGICPMPGAGSSLSTLPHGVGGGMTLPQSTCPGGRCPQQQGFSRGMASQQSNCPNGVCPAMSFPTGSPAKNGACQTFGANGFGGVGQCSELPRMPASMQTTASGTDKTSSFAMVIGPTACPAQIVRQPEGTDPAKQCLAYADVRCARDAIGATQGSNEDIITLRSPGGKNLPTKSTVPLKSYIAGIGAEKTGSFTMSFACHHLAPLLGAEASGTDTASRSRHTTPAGGSHGRTLTH